MHSNISHILRLVKGLEGYTSSIGIEVKDNNVPRLNDVLEILPYRDRFGFGKYNVVFRKMPLFDHKKYGGNPPLIGIFPILYGY